MTIWIASSLMRVRNPTSEIPRTIDERGSSEDPRRIRLHGVFYKVPLDERAQRLRVSSLSS